jgi:GntR family transcriptional regulator
MSREVAYHVLASHLREAIRAGTYEDGRPLPTEMELAARYSLSRTTVRRAMQDLVAEGAVYRVPGKGTYATAASDRYLPGIGSVEDTFKFSSDAVNQCEIIAGLETRIDVDAAARLRLESDAVVTLALKRLTNGIPFSVSHVAFPLPIGHLLTDEVLAELTALDATLSITGIIDPLLAKPVMYTEQTISAVPLPPMLAHYLDAGEGDPCLRIDRLHTDIDGQSIVFTASHFNPKIFTYRLRFKRASGGRKHQ